MLTAKYFISTASFIMCTAEYFMPTATYNMLTAKPYKPTTTTAINEMHLIKITTNEGTILKKMVKK